MKEHINTQLITKKLNVYVTARLILLQLHDETSFSWFACQRDHGATKKEVAEFKDADETDTQTQAHETSDGGEDIEGVVARMLRHVFLIQSDVIDVKLEHALSYFLFLRHRKLECASQTY